MTTIAVIMASVLMVLFITWAILFGRAAFKLNPPLFKTRIAKVPKLPEVGNLD